jgi:HEAT repeat protein
MTIIAEFLLMPLVGYLINIASGERSAAIAATRDAKLREALEKNEALRKALASTHSIRDEVCGACTELARLRANLGVPAHEEPLWQLLSDDVFQADLTEWLMAGAIEEGNAVKSRLLQAMETALVSGGASPEQITSVTTGYFEAVDKAVFAHPALAHWRQQLSLDYLRGQVTVLRNLAEQAAGVYTLAKQKEALDRYCEIALASWDIIDLSNLPEGDVQITTQQLLLRQLYMPLRIEIEPSQRGEAADAALARLEQGREARRHREAGHFFPDELDFPDLVFERKPRSPVGKHLGVSRRLVVLGDPGGGKTTMLRWMATAYLLLHKGDAAFSKVPDTDTLPNQPWIPVLIRCRELGEVDLCRCFTDFLTQHLNKTELLPEEATIMRAVILDRIAKGEALLLVDGLDEITNPQVRMQFCQELERTAARYPNAPIVVTSRIVGYRDMPYRMGAGFEHGVIAELNRKDKDLFAQRWVEVTEQHQPAPEKAKRVQELIEALHSSDRIERLTGNPMLLTTLALVKRKVGKLPNRRTKLYAEAVSVLLNWNPRLYQTIEEDEAIPQLEYLAYEMCRRGVQRLTDDEVLELLENLRVEYPKIRAVRSRDPREFLRHLEQRSSILIRSGGAWQKNNPSEKPVWEFRHLTFQEYLASRALLDGRYPARGKPKSLAEQVAPLAGTMEKVQNRGPRRSPDEELDVPESWREALRLLVADCKDDDVDDVLLAILNPMDGEDAAKTGRPRAVLAALCLADEPNVSEENAALVLATFAARVADSDGKGPVQTSLDRTALEVANSIWSHQLKLALIEEFVRRPSDSRHNAGGLWGMAEVSCWKKSAIPPKEYFTSLVERLNSDERVEVISAAVSLMQAAFEGCAEIVDDLTGSILKVLTQADLPANAAASWALGWLSRGSFRTPENKSVWLAKGGEVDLVIRALKNSPLTENFMRRWLVNVLGYSKDLRAFDPLLERLNDQDADVRKAVIEALVQLGDKQAVAPLLAKLDDQDANVRRAVIEALAQLGDKQAVVPLLAKLDDGDANVRRAVIEALAQLGDKQAVVPLLAKLDDGDANVRRAVIGALGNLGDKQAVAPLLAKLEDQAANVRMAVIGALGQLGDKQAVAPLLAKLEDQDANFRMAVIGALGQLGDKQAVAPLLAKLEDQDANVAATAAVALHTLVEPKGIAAIIRFLASDDVEVRQAAVRAYAQQKEHVDQRLLSRDLDASDPWIDPKKPVSVAQVTKAASQLDIPNEQVRSRFEAMAGELNLKLGWKP